MTYIVILIISFSAALLGTICGIGGGVVLKPLMDAMSGLEIAEINFLSGCTVLCMSSYSVLKEKVSRRSVIDQKITPFLGIGAAVGGLLGKQIFQIMWYKMGDTGKLRIIQAVLLMVITAATLAYTFQEKHCRTYRMNGKGTAVFIGGVLGVFSAFLGIGGGPMNLVVLYTFYSMSPKAAASNSLYIIMLSQLASILWTAGTKELPNVSPVLLMGMSACGITGGMAGRKIQKKIEDNTVNKLFRLFLVIILGICVYNISSH